MTGPTARFDALLALGRAAEAERGHRALLAADPGNVEAALGLARALLALDQPLEAVDLARRVLAGAPDHLDGLIVLTAAAVAADDVDTAMAAATKAVEQAPIRSVVHYNLACVLIRSGEPEQALTALDRSRSLDPLDAATEVLRGQVLLSSGRLGDAEEAASAALGLDPQNAAAHQLIGWLRLLRPGTGDARAASIEALRVDPTNEHSRDLHASVVKSRNPLYRRMLRSRQTQQSPVTVGLLGLAFLVAVFTVREVQNELVTRIVIGLGCVIALAVVAVEPLMNVALMTTPAGRGLLSPLTRRATTGFAASVAAAAGVVAVAILTADDDWLGAAGALVIWGVAMGFLGTVRSDRVRWAVWVHAAGVVVNVAMLVAVALGGWSDRLAVLVIGLGIGTAAFSRVR